MAVARRLLKEKITTFMEQDDSSTCLPLLSLSAKKHVPSLFWVLQNLLMSVSDIKVLTEHQHQKGHIVPKQV